MSQGKLSLKQIQNLLPPGKQVMLIHNALGPCQKLRTVTAVKRDGIQMTTESGEYTYMFLDRNTRIELTENGFKSKYKDELLTEYVFV